MVECWVWTCNTRDSGIRSIIATQEFDENLDVIVVVHVYTHLVMQILLTEPVLQSLQSLGHSLVHQAVL